MPKVSQRKRSTRRIQPIFRNKINFNPIQSQIERSEEQGGPSNIHLVPRVTLNNIYQPGTAVQVPNSISNFANSRTISDSISGIGQSARAPDAVITIQTNQPITSRQQFNAVAGEAIMTFIERHAQEQLPELVSPTVRERSEDYPDLRNTDTTEYAPLLISDAAYNKLLADPIQLISPSMRQTWEEDVKKFDKNKLHGKTFTQYCENYFLNRPREKQLAYLETAAFFTREQQARMLCSLVYKIPYTLITTDEDAVRLLDIIQKADRGECVNNPSTFDIPRLLLCMKLEPLFISTLTHNALLDWYRNGSFNVNKLKSDNNYNGFSKRINKLTSMTPSTRRHIFNTEEVMLIVRLFPNETLMEREYTLTDKELIDKYGMVGFNRNHFWQYAQQINNLTSDNTIVITGSNWNYMSDAELQELSGVKKIHSRLNYIKQLISLRSNKEFFFPYKPQLACNYEEGAVTGEEFDDPDEVVLAYGTIKIDNISVGMEGSNRLEVITATYRLYTLSELSNSFFTNKFSFYHSEDLKLKFTDDEVYYLLYLCRLAKISEDNIIILRSSVEYVRNTRGNITDMIHNMKQPRYREYFQGLFEFGMYCRTWKGHGHAYPLLKEDTENPNKDTDFMDTTFNKAAYDKLEELYKICIADDTLRFIPVWCWEEEKPAIFKYLNNMEEFLKLLLDGKFCIRVGSRLSIHTSMYYMKSCFDAGFSDLDGKSIHYMDVKYIS